MTEAELGMLTSDTPAGSWSSRLEYDMPDRFKVQHMAARILAISPKIATAVDDLGWPIMMNHMHQYKTCVATREDIRVEDESVGWDMDGRDFDDTNHLQGYVIITHVRDHPHLPWIRVRLVSGGNVAHHVTRKGARYAKRLVVRRHGTSVWRYFFTSAGTRRTS